MFKASSFYLFAIWLILAGCSGLEQSEQQKLRRQNAKGEFVYRRHDEIQYPIPPLKPRLRERYPWENVGSLSKITKEYFRCKGSSLNPLYANPQDARQQIVDCGGREKHSLPIHNDKEFVYPILMELLNYLQTKTQKKVVITCGYRCPLHNTYADPTTFNQTSKHMIGAEVDFYIQGLESNPEETVKLIMNFYKETPRYKGKKEFEDFLRYEKSDTNVSIHPWYNKEIMIKLFKRNEGRDLDNRHPHPYVCLQVRFDRERNEKVAYTYKEATGYRRY